jgi:hypothetical protein
MPLMEFYLYPPKYLSTAAVATLIPPAGRQAGDAESYRAPKPEPAGDKNVLPYANAPVAPASAI